MGKFVHFYKTCKIKLTHL